MESLLVRILLGWIVLAAVLGWFVGSFIKAGRGGDDE